MAFVPRVIDLYGPNTVRPDSFVRGRAAGLWGVIHKCTQGVSFHDAKYTQRRKMAADAGLLWGAYHFNHGENYKAQAKNFIDAANPDQETLMVVDYEDSTVNMSIHSCVAFMKTVEDQLGRSCAIYSGNRLKENIGLLKGADLDYILSKRLWICQYGPKLTLPKGFKKHFLWQYTGDGVGPEPHQVDGFNPGQDYSVYDGTYEQLRTEWMD